MTARLAPLLTRSFVALAALAASALVAHADPSPPAPDASGSADANEAPPVDTVDFDTAPQADTGSPITCQADSQCGSGLVCLFNSCSQPQRCSTDTDCWTDNCVDGICRETPACATDAECADTKICAFRSCQRCDEGCCRDDAGCGPGLLCDRSRFGGESSGAAANPVAPGDPPGICRVDPALPTTADCAGLCSAMAPCSIAAAAQLGFIVSVERWLADCELGCSFIAGTSGGAASLIDRAEACVAPLTTCVDMQAACGGEVAAVQVQMEQKSDQGALPDAIRFGPLAFPLPGSGPFPDTTDGVDTVDSTDAFGGPDSGPPGARVPRDEGCSGAGGAPAFGLLLALLALGFTARRRRAA